MDALLTCDSKSWRMKSKLSWRRSEQKHPLPWLRGWTRVCWTKPSTNQSDLLMACRSVSLTLLACQKCDHVCTIRRCLPAANSSQAPRGPEQTCSTRSTRYALKRNVVKSRSGTGRDVTGCNEASYGCWRAGHRVHQAELSAAVAGTVAKFCSNGRSYNKIQPGLT